MDVAYGIWICGRQASNDNKVHSDYMVRIDLMMDRVQATGIGNRKYVCNTFGSLHNEWMTSAAAQFLKHF
jgi:hypothetical protein